MLHESKNNMHHLKKNLTLNLIDYDEQFILNKKTNKEIKKDQQQHQQQQQKTKETLHQRKKREKNVK